MTKTLFGVRRMSTLTLNLDGELERGVLNISQRRVAREGVVQAYLTNEIIVS